MRNRFYPRSWPHPRRSLAAALAAAALSVSALAMLFIWQQASVDQLIVRLARERDRHHQLETEVNSLSLEATRLSSLALVEERAARELQLTRPDPEQIVNLQFEGTDEGRTFALRPLVGEANARPRRVETLP
jgi:cell division protein FtsL